MSTLLDRPLGDVVTTLPGSARVLESFGLDYCCGGKRPLGAACAAAGVDPDVVLHQLTAIAPQQMPDWASMDPAELVDHLESTHHVYLHAELPRLDALAEKVAAVHGANHPELMDVLADVRELRDDLEPHLMKEERVLFPAIREQVRAASTGAPAPRLDAPISVMMTEHDRAGELLAQLRAHTAGFDVPFDGCASYSALYEGLEQLEADTHQHVHKENNVLFPAVLGARG